MSVQLVTKWFFSRTGRELLLEDKRRILPNITHGAIHELGAFRNLMAYANTTMDVIVPYGTSIIQVGKGLRTAACATGDRTIAAVHPHGVCSCFLDDGSAVPVKSDSELDSETETRDTDAAGEAKSEDVIPTIVMRVQSGLQRTHSSAKGARTRALAHTHTHTCRLRAETEERPHRAEIPNIAAVRTELWRGGAS